jgi:predicted nucleic acid-binding protein
VNVYVETNFVLEIALRQEQLSNCETIVGLCREHKIHLIIPAYSLAEPYETLIRRHRERKKLKNSLDTELNQLARTEFYTSDIHKIQNLTNILIKSTEDEMNRLENIKSDLIGISETIPLNSEILNSSAKHQKEHDLSPQDSIVYTSVIYHLKQSKPENACFLNKNSKDFDDPDISEMLEKYKCKMLTRFDHGHQYIINRIS